MMSSRIKLCPLLRSPVCDFFTLSIPSPMSDAAKAVTPAPRPMVPSTAGAASAAAPPVATVTAHITTTVPTVAAILVMPCRIWLRPVSYFSTSFADASPLMLSLASLSPAVTWSVTSFAEGLEAGVLSDASSLIKAAQMRASSVRLISEPSSPIRKVMAPDTNAACPAGSPPSLSGSPMDRFPWVFISMSRPVMAAFPCVSIIMQDALSVSE